jgi:L-2-hydroxyglutarate oxidase
VSEERVYLCVVGGGIVGLATAWAATKRRPGERVVVLEKEDGLAFHQTGRNSGVIHSGIYYKPGSLKARTCRAGREALLGFCQEHGVAFELCGKIVVALDESELPALEKIRERATANGARVEDLGPERLAEVEPHAAGIRALRVPETGIIDYRGVCNVLARLITEAGGEVRFGTRVKSLIAPGDHYLVETTTGTFQTDRVVNCAGLHSDRVAKSFGDDPEAKIIPFRGEYYELTEDAKHLCKHLIYPVPDASFPFLGVHFTRMISGAVECGPNAVLAYAREGYTKTTINIPDLFDSLTYPGFLRLAAKHWRTGLGEVWRSWSKDAFVKALRRLIPEVHAEHLRPAPAGVRAQALLPTGELVDDFLFGGEDGVVHVLNAPSPGATASLAIGEAVVDRLESTST